MGGGYHTGNWSAVAEFNIIVDPEAAHIVFNERWPLTMVGLDLTHQALATPEVEEKIKAIGSECSEFVLGLFAFFRKAYKEAQKELDPVKRAALLIKVNEIFCEANVLLPIISRTVVGAAANNLTADISGWEVTTWNVAAWYRT